jgi:hypothetical protein
VQYLCLEINFYKKSRFKYLSNDINFVLSILMHFFIFSQSSFSGSESNTYSRTDGVVAKHDVPNLIG